MICISHGVIVRNKAMLFPIVRTKGTREDSGEEACFICYQESILLMLNILDHGKDKQSHPLFYFGCNYSSMSQCPRRLGPMVWIVYDLWNYDISCNCSHLFKFRSLFSQLHIMGVCRASNLSGLSENNVRHENISSVLKIIHHVWKACYLLQILFVRNR